MYNTGFFNPWYEHWYVPFPLLQDKDNPHLTLKLENKVKVKNHHKNRLCTFSRCFRVFSNTVNAFWPYVDPFQ